VTNTVNGRKPRKIPQMKKAFYLPRNYLTPKMLNFEELLKIGRYCIPSYQRDYRWGSGEVRDLWEDITRLYGRAFEKSGEYRENASPHFLGAIVVEAPDSGGHEDPTVIDGQQRLVTISIALRSLLFHVTDSGWQSTVESLIKYASAGMVEPRVNLQREAEAFSYLICCTSNPADREGYFSKVDVQKDSSLEKIRDSFSFFDHKLAEFILESEKLCTRETVVNNLCCLFTQLLVVLYMSVEEAGVAYEVFERLNARGLELTPGELLKNKVFSIAARQNVLDTVVEKWTRIAECVESMGILSLTEIFYYWYLINHGSEIKSGELYNSLAKLLESKTVRPEKLVDEILELSTGLATCEKAGSDFNKQTQQSLKCLTDQIKNRFGWILVMAGLTRHSVGDAELDEVISLTHNYVFRRFIVEGLSLESYRREIASIARDYIAKMGTVDNLASSLKEKSQDSTFIARFKECSVKSNKLGFYIIERIENYLSRGAGTTLFGQSARQHLEHIMPKVLGDGWSHIDEEEHVLYLNRIGNLLVLEGKINSEIRNEKMATKVSGYKKSTLKLPGVAENYLRKTRWTAASIESRQEWLADQYACDVWKL